MVGAKHVLQAARAWVTAMPHSADGLAVDVTRVAPAVARGA
jgi:hypothetical protein